MYTPYTILLLSFRNSCTPVQSCNRLISQSGERVNEANKVITFTYIKHGKEGGFAQECLHCNEVLFGILM